MCSPAESTRFTHGLFANITTPSRGYLLAHPWMFLGRGGDLLPDTFRWARTELSRVAHAEDVRSEVPKELAAPFDFSKDIAPILEKHCLRCHGGDAPKGGLSLTTREAALRGGESGAVLVPGNADDSRLLAMISGAKPRMPRGGPPLAAGDVDTLRRWIASGASWPESLTLRPSVAPEDEWWSLRPLVRPLVPRMSAELAAAHPGWNRHPVDAFVMAKLVERGLFPNPPADRRTLIRRAYFDLLGLPPSPEAVDAFVNDAGDGRRGMEPFDRRAPCLAPLWRAPSPPVARRGTLWRHARLRQGQGASPRVALSGLCDPLLQCGQAVVAFRRGATGGGCRGPGTAEGITALGFLAAGPWDFVGQVELREETLDKKITRNLDRDDMVATTLNAFCSLTVQCARCHDHKFDPISQRDYYNLQAVFAAVDRADRPFEPDERVAAERVQLTRRRAELAEERAKLEQRLRESSNPELVAVNRQIDEVVRSGTQPARPEFGYHSAISADPAAVKWVQVDLGSRRELGRLLYAGCHDTFNNIGAGFGFPVRYRIDVSDDPAFKQDVVTVLDRTRADQPNPGVKPQVVSLVGRAARYVRFTATKLAPRQGDFIFALAEIAVFGADGQRIAGSGP